MKTITQEGLITHYFPADGTSLQGNINISYAELVKAFGREDSKGDDYKVQAEWYIQTPAGIATIYDYKEGNKYNGKDGIAKSKVTDWHIGGHSAAVVPWIYKALKLKIEECIYDYDHGNGSECITHN